MRFKQALKVINFKTFVFEDTDVLKNA